MGHLDNAADVLESAANLLDNAFPYRTKARDSFDNGLYALSLYYQAVVEASNRAEHAATVGEAYRRRVARHHEIKITVREIHDLFLVIAEKVENLEGLTSAYQSQLTGDATNTRRTGT